MLERRCCRAQCIEVFFRHPGHCVTYEKLSIAPTRYRVPPIKVSGLAAFENMTARTGTHSEKKPNPLTVQEAEFRSSCRMSVVDPGFAARLNDNGEQKRAPSWAMLVSPAANCWSGFQELNTRLKDDFWSVWLDGACLRALSRAGQSLRTNIQFRGDEAPVSLPPSAKARIGKGNCGARTRCQTEWALR